MRATVGVMRIVSRFTEQANKKGVIIAYPIGQPSIVKREYNKG